MGIQFCVCASKKPVDRGLDDMPIIDASPRDITWTKLSLRNSDSCYSARKDMKMTIDGSGSPIAGPRGHELSRPVETNVRRTATGFTNGIENNQSGFLDPYGDEYLIAGRNVSWWTDRFQTPLHINYAPLIRGNVQAFINVFRNHYPKGGIRYAAKACAHPTLLEIMWEEGAGADVASHNEAKCALDAGIEPKFLAVNGNCKEEILVETAIAKDMLIVADSIEEFLIVSQTAKRMGMMPRVLLRISGFDLGHVTAAGIFTAGNWSKFGAHLEDVPEFIKSLEDHSHVRFLGFHTHIGSQITDVEPYRAVLGHAPGTGSSPAAVRTEMHGYQYRRWFPRQLP